MEMKREALYISGVVVDPCGICELGLIGAQLLT